MYTGQELKRAAQIIKQVAQNNNISEEQVRAEMQEAMNSGRNNPDPVVQARWKDFHYTGAEPTLEEFILWVASMVEHPMA